MKIVHVVPAISEEASGPSYSVPRLCEALLGQGSDVTLAALAWSEADRKLPYLKTFPMDVAWPRRLGASRSMQQWLRGIAGSGQASIFHNHGMWQMNALYATRAARYGAGRCRVVVSPRGALSDWAMRHGSPVKKLFWPLLQRSALQSADCFHATAESEYEDIRRLGFRQPVTVIPNGIDIPVRVATQANVTAQRTLLFLGRIHKKKGLEMLLPAWASLQQKFTDWRLAVVGDDKGYQASSGYLDELRRLANTLGAQRVEFLGALHGEQKWAAYRGADLFVLPTYSENFGLAVAEALASGTPAIVTRGAPWSGLESAGAGWWTEVSIQGLTAALTDAMLRTPGELAVMGQRGRQWAQQEFAWGGIGEKMSMTYQWLAGMLEQRPGWIITD